MYEKLNIKDWDNADKPREKLILNGKQSLSNAELLAILIGSGTPQQSAVELCKNILQSVDNNLHKLAQLNINDLIEFKGIGEAKAISIIAALEIARRKINDNLVEKVKIRQSQDAFKVIAPVLVDLQHEEFWILLLSRSNTVISKHLISKGGISSTIVDVKIILKHATQNLASGIILTHNHPSGNKKASAEDLKITAKIKEAASFFDINILDHLIIYDNEYLSFADEGLI